LSSFVKNQLIFIACFVYLMALKRSVATLAALSSDRSRPKTLDDYSVALGCSRKIVSDFWGSIEAR
jgi:hypothetical protein